MLSQETKAEIRRLFRVEGWKIGTIASALQIHHTSVKRIIEDDGQKNESAQDRSSILSPYEDYVRSLIHEYPNLAATRVYQMIRERGYDGSIYPVRRFIKKNRPKRKRVYQDLHWIPAEAAQVDWGDFGRVKIAQGSHRRLNLFVIVLCYSRSIYARFFYDQKMAALLEGHVCAFKHWGGNPRRVIYDNMRTAVVSNIAGNATFTESLIELANHYNFRPTACNPRSGWEKGKVERAIRYIRSNFALETRRYSGLNDLNNQMLEWLTTIADKRPFEDYGPTIEKALEKEKASLLVTPTEFEAYDEKTCKVSKKGMIQFDCNLYSVPPKWVGELVIVRTNSTHVSVLSSSTLLTRHQRCWEKGKRIVKSDHIEEILADQKIRTKSRDRSLIVKRIPSGSLLLEAWTRRSENLTQLSRRLGELIGNYGEARVEEVAKLALELDTTHPDSIEHLLEREGVHPKSPAPRYAREDLEGYTIEQSDLKEYDEL